MLGALLNNLFIEFISVPVNSSLMYLYEFITKKKCTSMNCNQKNVPYMNIFIFNTKTVLGHPYDADHFVIKNSKSYVTFSMGPNPFDL